MDGRVGSLIYQIGEIGSLYMRPNNYEVVVNKRLKDPIKKLIGQFVIKKNLIYLSAIKTENLLYYLLTPFSKI